MSHSPWVATKRLLGEALERPPAERAQYVIDHCPDPYLRGEVLELLMSSAPLSEIIAAPALQHGTELGPYVVERLLGRGGMGEVYLARDTRLGREVAIKILPAALNADRERLDRFEREARLLAGLNHPRICSVFDVGHQDGLDFLVLEYVEGQTLATRLEQGPLPIDEAIDCASQIADALELAHAQGVVHRDVKPGNVMLTAAGIKLLDFGLARIDPTRRASEPAPSVAGVTAVGTILGTWPYMAPELLEGREADIRSDIWSFGCLLFEMVTARVPFDGRTQAALIAAIIERDAVAPSALRPHVPPVLDRIVGRCLAKSPDDRWQSVGEIRRELEQLAAGTRERRSLAQVSRDIRPRERIAWLLAAAVTVAAIAGIGFERSARRVDRQGEPIRLSLDLPEYFGRPSDLALSPNGRHLAFVARSRPGGAFVVWVRSLNAFDATPLSGTEGVRQRPFWSPDGRALGFFANGKLKRVDVATGTVQVICDAPSGRGGAWAANDTIVFAPDGGSGLYAVESRGSIPSPVTKLAASPEERSHRMPSFFPDGRHFVYTVFGADGWYGLAVGSTEGGEGRLLVRWAADARYPLETTQAYATEDSLLFVRGQSILVQHLDSRSWRLTGDARPVGATVDMDADRRQGFAASLDGTIVYRPEPPYENRRLTWTTRTGQRAGSVWDEGPVSDLSISPDGRQAAVRRWDPPTRMSNIWVVDLASGAASPLTEGRFAESPLWSTDGSTLFFRIVRDLDNSEVHSKPANGSRPEEVFIDSPAGPKIPIGWMRDGTFLFIRAGAVGNDLWARAPDRARPAAPLLKREQLVQIRDPDASVTPDGGTIAYMWMGKVYIQQLPAGAPVHVASVVPGRSVYPRWRGDGNELYYLDGHKLMAVSIRREPRLEVGTAAALFDLPENCGAYAPAPDGQRFLIEMPTNPPKPPSTLHVLLNSRSSRH